MNADDAPRDPASSDAPDHADAPATISATPPPRGQNFWDTSPVPGWVLTVLLALLIVLLAAATRLPRLATAPPGFRSAEASGALYAQSVHREHLPVVFGGGNGDVQEPFFIYVMRLTGSLYGWDVVGARLAAALCGILVALGCALWYTRALGRIWGLAGGLLVATSFWQLMFSRQAIPPISMALFAAGGLWLLWLALSLPAQHSRRLRLLAYAAAGAAFGAGLATDSGFWLVVIPLLGALLLLRERRQPAGRLTVDPLGLLVALLVMLAVMTPLAGYYARHPDDLTPRATQVREEDSGTTLRDPRSIAGGYLEAARSVVWDGDASATINQPGRPILDPLLAIWALGGLALALRHPLRPLHGIALLWFAVFILPAALSSAGHPARMLAATPAVFLFPLLAMEAVVRWVGRWGRTTQLAAGLIVALSIAGSAAWSLHDYFRVWAPSQPAYVAFQGDLRASLEAIDTLPPDGAPVYYSTWTQELLVTYLAPQRPFRAIDGRTSLALPSTGIGYLVAPSATTPDPALLALFGNTPALRHGTAPDGSPAWQAWLLDSRLREDLPYVVPPILLADAYRLIGFDIVSAPAADGAPYVAVTLVWQGTAGAPGHIARVRLLPVDPLAIDPQPTSNDVPLSASATALLGSGATEILITRLLVPFPVTDTMVADVQVALLDATGNPLPPVSAPAGSTNNFAQINRIQYRVVP